MTAWQSWIRCWPCGSARMASDRTRGRPRHTSRPTQRARKAGYGGGVSENIARGSTNGRATFKQWYGSSGHHRNMLGRRHVELGVGRSEDFWTQNFGSASRAFDLPKKKKPPAEDDK